MTISFQFLQGLVRDHAFQLFLCRFLWQEFVHDFFFAHISKILHHYSVICLNDTLNLHVFYYFLPYEKLAPYCLNDVFQFYIVFYQSRKSIMETFSYFHTHLLQFLKLHDINNKGLLFIQFTLFTLVSVPPCPYKTLQYDLFLYDHINHK